MSVLQGVVFITFDINTKEIEFIRNDNITDYDTNATNIYVQSKYKKSDGETVYLSPSEIANYNFSLYTMKPLTNNVSEITGEVTNELIEQVRGGVIKFVIPKACTNRSGIVKCELHINKEKEKIASTRFILDIQQSLVTKFNDSLLDDEDFPVLQQLILEIQKDSNIDDNNRSKITSYSSDKVENIKEDLSSQIKDIENNKADKTTTSNLQQQVNNLVLGAVGDGNNAEVVQARANYDTLNERLNDADETDKKIYNQINRIKNIEVSLKWGIGTYYNGNYTSKDLFICAKTNTSKPIHFKKGDVINNNDTSTYKYYLSINSYDETSDSYTYLSQTDYIFDSEYKVIEDMYAIICVKRIDETTMDVSEGSNLTVTRVEMEDLVEELMQFKEVSAPVLMPSKVVDWKIGAYNQTGAYSSSTNYITTKQLLTIQPGYICSNNENVVFLVRFYDENGNFKNSKPGDWSYTSNLFITETSYVRIVAKYAVTQEITDINAVSQCIEIHESLDKKFDNYLSKEEVRNLDINKFETLIKNKLYMIEEEPLRLYKSSIFANLKNRFAYDIGAFSYKEGELPFIEQEREKIELNPMLIGDTLSLFLLDDNLEQKIGLSLVVEKASANGIINKKPKINMIGDSLTYRGLPTQVKNSLSKYCTPTFIGTVTDKFKTPCEGRAGWCLTHYTGYRTCHAEGEELPSYPSFLKLADETDKANYPEFCFTRTVSAKEQSYAEVVQLNGDTTQDFYIFDYANYLTINSFDTPDFVIINMGTNDIWRYGNEADGGVEILLNNLKFIIERVHEANSNIKICIIPLAIYGLEVADNRKNAMKNIINLDNEYSYIDIVNEHISQSKNLSFPCSETANTNRIDNTYIISDKIHTENSGFVEGSKPIAFYILNKL